MEPFPNVLPINHVFIGMEEGSCVHMARTEIGTRRRSAHLHLGRHLLALCGEALPALKTPLGNVIPGQVWALHWAHSLQGESIVLFL